MARRPEGWTIRRDPRTSKWCVRFRHDGRQFSRSTGTQDRGEAQSIAARIHAEVTSGVRPLGVARHDPLTRLTSEWLTSLESSRSAETIEAYEGYVTAHWGHAWSTLDRMTDASIADYMRARLRLVTASTVRKELSALRGFIAWCMERGALRIAPVVPPVPRRAVGTSSKPQTRVDLSAVQVEAIIAAMPEARRSRGDLKPRHVRELYLVAWETGLRVGTLKRVEVPKHYRRGSTHLAISDDIDKARWGRGVPLSPRARETLDSIAPRSGLVWGPIVGRGLLKAAAKAVHAAKVIKIPDWRHVSDHDIRHATITHLASSPGASIAGIAFLVGHTYAGTTSRYVHAAQDAAAEALAARGTAAIVAPRVAPTKKATPGAKSRKPKSPSK
jgi:integrase